jgi:lipoic acid synthetase
MLEALGVLREHHVEVLTVGQYLRPTARHLPIVRYWHPDEFKALEVEAYRLGFTHVAAGPLVRSSYHADQHVAPRADQHVAPSAGRHPAPDAPAAELAASS